MDLNSKELIEKINNGEIGILPTDTLYGIHGLALNKNTVEKIYEIRNRNPQKPFIILISSIEDLKKFKIEITEKVKQFLGNHWPNKLSVVLPCPHKEFEYLHRNTNTLAFRVPRKSDLLELLNKVGPLISTSVNPEGQEPAKTIEEAKNYFSNLDFYIDQGRLDSEPSTVINIDKNGKIEILRQGAVKIT